MTPRFRARKTFRIGPLYFNFSTRGFTSWGIRVGPWSKNFTRGTWALDTPGPGSVHGGGRKR